MKRVVHRIETSVFPKVKVTCGREPWDIKEHAGLGKWKGVTCKKCLGKRQKREGLDELG